MGLIIDLFAGGGGASTGIEWALGRSPDIAINHDPMALAMHKANHPSTKHLVENVWHVKPRAIIGDVLVDLLWASPDCTHFSKAKGAAPKRDVNRAKRSRGLAWVILRWAREARPTLIFMENVEEWIDWAPIRADGTPDPARKGETRKRFVRELKKLSYAVEIVGKDRACDHGAPTIRQRLVMVARCDGQPIVKPAATHSSPDKPRDLFSKPTKPYRTAAEIINWAIPCPSIFSRKKELAPATKRRIARGMKRYVIDNARPFIVPITHSGSDRLHSIDEPLRTITTAHRGELALATPFLTEYHSAKRPGDDRTRPVTSPLPTQTVENRFALATPFTVGVGGPTYSGKPRAVDVPFQTVLNENHTGIVRPFIAGCGGRAAQSGERSLDRPLGTLTAKADQILVAPFITKFRADSPGSPVTQPLPTVTANSFIKRPGGTVPLGLASAVLVRQFGNSDANPVDRPVGTITAGGAGKTSVAAAFIAKHYGGHETPGAPLSAPLSTITTQDHHHLVATHLLHLRGGGVRFGQPLDEPVPALTAGGTHVGTVHAFLTKYYSEGGRDQSVADPLHTITTKARLSLVTTTAGEIPMSDEDRYDAWWVARFVEDYSVPANDDPQATLLIPEPRLSFVCAAGIPIVDIGMRMLDLRELYRAQGFPDSYIIYPKVWRIVRGKLVYGPLPKTDGTRMCGNSVSPYQACAWIAANAPPEMIEHREAA